MTEIKIDLALFGQKAAGKTVYSATLVHEIQKRHNRSYYIRNADVYIEDRITELQRGEWPSATLVYADEEVMFEIVAHDNSNRVTYRTIDLPGEIIVSLFTPGIHGIIWRDQLRRSFNPYRDYVEKICTLIDKSNAFMFLIDPKGNEEKNERVVEDTAQDLMCTEIIDEIIRRKKVKSPDEMPPIAFVFTKWDLFQNQFPEFEDYAVRVLYVTLGTHGKILRTMKIMKCSGVGKVKKVVVKNEDGTKTEYKPNPPIEPQGVAETLFWIVSMIGKNKGMKKDVNTE